MTDGFLTDVETALLFFRYCQRYKVNDLQARRAVLGRIAKKNKARYLRDVELELRGKKALYVKKRDG